MKGLDKKILLELLRNADQPKVRIAEKVDASRQTVSKKIKNFKKSGLIKDLKTEVDPEKIGLDVRALVFLQEVPQDEARENIKREISKIPDVSKFFRLFGRYSGVLEVWTEDRERLSSLVKKIHELEGIRETETFIVHDVLKDRSEDPLIQLLEGE